MFALVRVYDGQPLARAHASTSRSVASAPVDSSHWTAVGARPLEHVEMASLSCTRTRPLVPGTAVGPRPLEHLEMASLGCLLAC
jgi:hypothetical protein